MSSTWCSNSTLSSTGSKISWTVLKIKNLSNTQHIPAIISCNYYSRHNFEEDMSDKVSELNPVRWKVFQCLPIEAENRGPEVIQDSNMPNFLNLNFKHSLISCFRLSDKWTLSWYLIRSFQHSSQGIEAPRLGPSWSQNPTRLWGTHTWYWMNTWGAYQSIVG